MKLMLAFAMLLPLLFTASAATENHTNGPYEISFNMNSTIDHIVETQKPVETNEAKVYTLMVNTSDKEKATILVAEYKNLTDSTPNTNEYMAIRDFEILGYNYNNSMQISQDLPIDGTTGFALMGNNSNGKRVIQAFYWLDSKDCECGPVSVGKTKVVITSSYPLDTTFWLVDKLHIEKSKNVSLNKTPVIFKPPS